MGFWSNLFGRDQVVLPTEFSGDVDMIGFATPAMWLRSMKPEQFFAEQPHLRTVTTFIARMVATVGLHVYERADDGGRERVRDTWVSAAIRKPNPNQSMYSLIYESIMDLCLHDTFIWFLTEDADLPERFRIDRIPPGWVMDYKWADPWTLKKIAIRDHKTGEPIWLPADRIVRVHGYSPTTVRHGLSPIEALKGTLEEQLESAAYRSQLWKNGPRISGVIERPKDAPKWDATARHRFKASWRAQYSGKGSGVGGTPVLEDGMQLKTMHLSAKDEDLVEMTKLSLSTVAQVYHINPTMVGLLDNANYSNVREFRQSLYGDSLGPLITQIEDCLNLFVLPWMSRFDNSIDPDRMYIEFNVESRLRGRFEEQAAVTSTAVGSPWMTRNEARAMNNLPAVDGGDDLIVPLNMTTEGAEDDPPGDPQPPEPGDESGGDE